MRRSTTKYLVDWGLYLSFCVIAVTGGIIGWIVPRGGGNHDDRFFLGLHRHGWIDIHLFFAILGVTLIVLHLVLSWSWVVSTTRRKLGKRWIEGFGLMAMSWLPILFLAWLVALIGSCFAALTW